MIYLLQYNKNYLFLSQIQCYLRSAINLRKLQRNWKSKLICEFQYKRQSSAFPICMAMKLVQSMYEKELNILLAGKVSAYELCIQQIYQKRFTITEIYMISDDLAVGINLGDQYTIITQQLRNICKIHRRFIAQSARTLCMNQSNYVSLAPDSKHKSLYTEQQLRVLKMKQSVVWILYNHYCNIAQSNRLVSIFWEIMQNGRARQSGQKYLELKDSVLNNLAIQELVPSSEYINIRPIQNCLKQLLFAAPVLKKEHLQEMYFYFMDSQSMLQPQIRQQIEKKKSLLKKQSSAKKQPLKKSSSKQKQLKKTAPLKQQISKKQKVTVKFEGKTQNWLQQSKNDRIGSKLSEILGGRFSIYQKEETQISKTAYQEIKKQIIPRTLLDLGLADEDIKLHFHQTVITAQVYDSNQQTENQKKQQKEQKQEQGQCKQVTKQQNGEKKKKKRKRNKKKKTENNCPQLVHNNSVKDQELMIPKLEHKESKQCNNEDQYLKKINKMIQKLVIDHNKRVYVPAPHRTLDQWRNWAKQNDPV